MSQSGYLAVLYQALVKYDKVYEEKESEWIPCGVIPSSGLVWQNTLKNRRGMAGVIDVAWVPIIRNKVYVWKKQRTFLYCERGFTAVRGGV